MTPLPKLTPPWWMDGSTLTQASGEDIQEPAMLTAGTHTFWQRIADWLSWPLQQTALTCDIKLLDLLAWENGITRFRGEPEWLYRRRVHYAELNAMDAGSSVGFARIFERLGFSVLSTRERMAGEDWDVIALELADSELASATDLMTAVVQNYGRTCRRYTIMTTNEAQITISCAEFNAEYTTLEATCNVSQP